MTGYTQVQQAMRVHTALDEDMLLLEGLAGEEVVSKPYLFELDFISLDRDIDGEQLLRTPMHVEIDLPDGSTRSIHGVVRRFVQRGRDGDLVSYRAEIVPWLWFLALAQDCRIFQGDDVLDIVEKVFKEQGYSDFESRCTRTYSKREYCVQYRESDLNFVSRLLEEEGIFYFFEHQDSKHVLVLADDMGAIKVCDGQPQARMRAEPVPDEDVVLSLDREHSVHSGKVTFGDYDYLQPTLTLRSTIAGDEPEEVYDYPGSFTDPDRGEERALLALEREEATRHVVRGSTTCRAFRTGTQFELQDHFGDAGNQTYAILELRHQARNGSYRSSSGGDGFDYRNDLIAIPPSVPYRPPLRSRKPSVHGAQTAEVVGPGGEKIYVDEHGRVKVQFHWDRQGGKDHNSSCWVRVSQNWAGKNWGGMFIPHIGQEVIVDFLEGDPDRPIITGRVYNAKNAPPQGLPANKHKSIIEDDFGNEIVFDATPGDEHIRIHSPSHDSYLEIGKSVKLWTESNYQKIIEGDEALFKVGMHMGGTVGTKIGLDFGGSIGFFLGYKVDVSASSSLSVSLGPSAKYSKGKEHKFSKDDFRQHSEDQAVIKSDKEVLVVGGSGSKTGLFEANDRGVTIQFADNKQPFLIKGSMAQAIAAGTGAVLGVGGQLGTSLLFEKSASDAARAGSFALMIAAGNYTGAVALSLLEALSVSPDPLTRANIHGPIHSTVNLSERGVELVAVKGGKDMAWIHLWNKRGDVEIEAEKQVNVVCKSGAVKVKAGAGQQFRAEAGDINLNATGRVNVNGKMIKLG